MDNQREEALWKIADENRGRFPNPSELAQAAANKLGALTFEDLKYLSRFMSLPGYFFAPEFVVNAITALIKDRQINSILDPYADTGSLLIPIAEKTNASHVYGIYQSTTARQLASFITGSKRVQWIQDDPIHKLDAIEGTFDLIISAPSFEHHIERLSFEVADGPVVVSDQRAFLGILKACTRLSATGTGAFILPASYIYAERSDNVYKNLNRFGLFVDAVVALPDIFEGTSVSTVLLVIRRGPLPKLFVGELSTDARRNAVLLENLKQHKPSQELALGALVEPSTFRSYEALVAQKRIEEFAQRSVLTPVLLNTITLEINLTKATEPPGFAERPNAVYLPLIGPSDAVTALTDLRLKPHNYAQLVLNPDKADPVYIAQFFNTPLGHMVRGYITSGVTIPKITKTTLSNAAIYLPPRGVQLQILQTFTKIQNLVGELESLSERLWDKPLQVQQLAKQVERVNREDRFEEWLDTLPFPLAAILWTYYTTRNDPKDAYEHLLHFFEALAEFYAIALLSGFKTNAPLYEEERKTLAQLLPKGSLGLTQATFGMWVNIASRLAKAGRARANQPEGQETIEKMFGTSRSDTLGVLFSSELIGHLQTANNWRNDWPGHGGYVAEQIAKERLVNLEQALAKVRRILGDSWVNYELIKPGPMRFVGGSFEHTVSRVMGLRFPFVPKQVTVAEPMEDDQLYLLAIGSDRPLKLLPFIKLGASPQSEPNACYFYNSFEGNGIKFVSYQFAQNPEWIEQFKDTASAIEQLRIQPDEAV